MEPVATVNNLNPKTVLFTDNLCTQINTTYNINTVKNIFFSVPYTILKILLLNILTILFSL